MLKLQSSKAELEYKMSFPHFSLYICSNLLDILTSYFIKILSFRERLDIDPQITKNAQQAVFWPSKTFNLL